MSSWTIDRKTRLIHALTQHFVPLHLDVIDETYMHAVHPESQSHFKLLIVSEAFVGQTPIQRQRAVNQLLMPEFQQGLHALSIYAWTPQQWFDKGGSVPESPPCQGGSKVSMS